MSVVSQSRTKSSQQITRPKSRNDQASQMQSKTSANFHISGDKMTLTQKNTICVPHSEIERMKENCLTHVDPESEKRLREKQELYEKSKSRVQNWPNTIHAIRKKKDETRFERFKKDEEERRRIDEEEAIYQAGVKREIIDKANKQIYEGSDRVKAFQSKLLLVDALLEREGQIELKQQLKAMEKVRDEIHVEQVKESIRKQEEEDARKKEELDEKKRHTQKMLKEQHDEMKVKYVKRMMDEKLEGEIIKQRALELIAKEKEDERKRREKAIQTQQEATKGNEYLKSIKLELKEKERLEDEKIKQYALQKEKITDMRRVREEIRFKEKQDQKQKLIDEQVKRLAALKSEEEHRVNKQIIEAQMKADDTEKRKRQAIEAQKKRFDESVQLTLKRKEEQAKAIKQEDIAYQAFWKNKNVQIHEKEKQEKLDAFDRAKHLQDFHLQQAAEKQKIREAAFLQELDETDKIKQRLENDDKNFNSWAERMVKEWHNDGKDIKPLLKELVDYNKRI